MQRNGASSEGGSAGEAYRFGDVVVDAAAHTLLRAGQAQSVEPKAFAVLLELLRHAGQLIEHEQLLDAVWGHRHVTPGVLTRAIAQLRAALDDHAHEPRFIQTQHALGYRFIGELRPPEPAIGTEDAEVIAAASAQPASNDEVGPPGDTAHPTSESADAIDNVSASGPRRVASPLPVTRWTWMLAALLMVVAGGLIWNQRKAILTRPQQASIAVLPFASLSSNRDDIYFAEGLAVEMHDALAGVPGLKVAACRIDSACGKRDADARTLGQLLGVATVLDASVRREGTRVRISARLVDTASGFTLWSHAYDRDASDVLATQNEIAHAVAQSLIGVLPDAGDGLRTRLTPTRNAVAYEAYIKGQRSLSLSGNDDEVDNALGFFNQAIAADSGFARAQAGICRSQLRRYERTRNADDFEGARVACAQASKMNPALGEVDLAVGELHRLHGEPAKAIEHFAKVQDDPALRPDAYIGMAKVHAAQGRQALALDYFQRARALRPGDANIFRSLGYQQYLRGNTTEAIAAYRKALELQPDDAGLWASLGGLYITAGDNDAAVKALERSIKLKPNGTTLSNLGALKNLAGDHAAAVDLYRRATQLDRGSFFIWGFLGDSLRASAAPATQTRDAFLRAADLAESYVQITPDDAKALAALGWYRVNLGEATRARARVAGSEALGTERGEVALFNAQTLISLGDVQAARERVAIARKAGVAEDRIAKNVFLRRALKH